MPATRREFLATASLALTGVILKVPHLGAQARRLSRPHLTLAPDALAPEPMTPQALRHLAAHALDAARSAGATYADVRVAYQQQCSLGVLGGVLGNVTITPQFMYGIRVMVDGAMAFIHGSVPNPDALAVAARNAVATARGYTQLNSSLTRARLDLVPVPVVIGEWETPIQLDPFSIPLIDQLALMLTLGEAAHARTASASAGFQWARETRVFASTEGSCVTQTLYTAQPEVNVGANKVIYAPGIELRILGPTAGGYECVIRPDLQDEIKATAETVAALAALPRGGLDVGRYPVVFDGATLGAVAVQTLGVALEVDRVLGYETGAGGSSYLSPPLEMLGSMVASPLLNVTAQRAVPSITAVQWDDEGVKTQPVTLITNGRLSNYCASRGTASALMAHATSRSAPVTGCMTAPNADHHVCIRVPHFRITPGPSPTTLEELCRDIPHGVLVRNVSYPIVDPQVSSGFLNFGDGVASAFEIVRGKIARRLEGNGLQFTTPRLWKGLTMLGDASTAGLSAMTLYKGQPEVPGWYTASAPAGLFKEIDVVNIRRWG